MKALRFREESARQRWEVVPLEKSSRAELPGGLRHVTERLGKVGGRAQFLLALETSSGGADLTD